MGPVAASDKTATKSAAHNEDTFTSGCQDVNGFSKFHIFTYAHTQEDFGN